MGDDPEQPGGCVPRPAHRRPGREPREGDTLPRGGPARLHGERLPAVLGGDAEQPGTAYCDLPTGDRDEDLAKAIECFQAALRVDTEKDFPQQWATTQNNLGEAYRTLPTGDNGENLGNAIQCFQAALRVATEKDFPQQWATTQNNLGAAHYDLPTGDRGQNLANAIEYFQAALRVYTEEDFPHDWAMTRFNMGLAYLHSARLLESADLMRQAVECFLDSARGYSSVGCPNEAEMARSKADQVEQQLNGPSEAPPSD